MKKCDYEEEEDQTKCPRFPDWAKDKKCPHFREHFLGKGQHICNGEYQIKEKKS